MNMKSIGLFVLLLATSLVVAAEPVNASKRISGALCELYDLMKNIFPPLIVLVVVMAAVIYAAGHVLGQEMGARAKSWALNLIIYTAIGIIIFLLVPWLLGQVVPELNLEKACA